MLGKARRRQVQLFRKRGDIAFAGAKLLDQANPVRMRDQLEDLGEFAGDWNTVRHAIEYGYPLN
ncbi:hypothetical protein [Blastomonas sp. CCH5-A3]|uniref:hypothetical protein n=1 Tax=Blastomonas sp. CCH5-A3 TaxID=1768761 RepID=UPI0008246A66|nr:hypothetical protein [Blastomonas sp. CCH5-A3]